MPFMPFLTRPSTSGWCARWTRRLPRVSTSATIRSPTRRGWTWRSRSAWRWRARWRRWRARSARTTASGAPAARAAHGGAPRRGAAPAGRMALAALIQDEVNVEGGGGGRHESAFATVTVKPNFKTLGKRCGPKLKAIGATLATWSFEEGRAPRGRRVHHRRGREAGARGRAAAAQHAQRARRPLDVRPHHGGARHRRGRGAQA